MSSSKIKSVMINKRPNKRQISLNLYKNKNIPVNKSPQFSKELKSLKYNNYNYFNNSTLNNNRTRENTSFTNYNINSSLNIGNNIINKVENEDNEVNSHSRITEESSMKLDERGDIDNIDLLETLYKTHSRPNCLKTMNDRDPNNDNSLNTVFDVSRNINSKSVSDDDNIPVSKLASKRRLQNSSNNIPSNKISMSRNHKTHPEHNKMDLNEQNYMTFTTNNEKANNNSKISNITFKGFRYLSNEMNFNELSNIKKERTYSNINNNSLMVSGFVQFAKVSDKEENILKSNVLKSKSNNKINSTCFVPNQSPSTIKSSFNPHITSIKISKYNSELNNSNNKSKFVKNALSYKCEDCEELTKEIVELRKEKMDLKILLTKCKKEMKKVVKEKEESLQLLLTKEKKSEKDREFMFKQDKEIDRLSSIIENFNLDYLNNKYVARKNEYNNNHNKYENILEENDILKIIKRENRNGPLKESLMTISTHSNNFNSSSRLIQNFNTKNAKQLSNHKRDASKTVKINYSELQNLKNVLNNNRIKVEETKKSIENEKEIEAAIYESQEILI